MSNSARRWENLSRCFRKLYRHEVYRLNCSSERPSFRRMSFSEKKELNMPFQMEPRVYKAMKEFFTSVDECGLKAETTLALCAGEGSPGDTTDDFVEGETKDCGRIKVEVAPMDLIPSVPAVVEGQGCCSSSPNSGDEGDGPNSGTRPAVDAGSNCPLSIATAISDLTKAVLGGGEAFTSPYAMAAQRETDLVADSHDVVLEQMQVVREADSLVDDRHQMLLSTLRGINTTLDSILSNMARTDPQGALCS
ncbi:hypothetical protein CBR_g39904 [Chara braunii]|uniref:Uncharacterized protein n=1 Tax=Chara braunii TaxID=69332 RepID=A0A388K1J1_CHABU|nr:hypothetical protein CBR_g39904 [Chara braunii]|eukprot:GBG63899.1 hypothetical protein CBR_g39904 [Chara braunii]